MKTYKLITLCVATLLFGACDKSLDQDVSLDVSVNGSENVSYDGQIITVKKGTPVEFLLSGNPDFLTFFSGETGKKYQYRDREQIDPSQIKKSTLDFSIWFQYGTLPMIEKHVYISDQFPGLSKTNFEQDSILVEQFEKDGIWEELVPQNGFPTATGSNDSKAYSLDMTKYLNKKVTIAVCYRGVQNTQVQPSMYFEQMQFTNTLSNDMVAKQTAGSFGLTPLNMKHKWNLTDQATMKTDREYGTVTNATSGVWNLVNINNGGFYLASSVAAKPLKYSWLVSDQLQINACTPDQGTQIKNISQRLDSYTYTYNQVGIYNVTFLANNANMEYASTMTRHLVVNVVE